MKGGPKRKGGREGEKEGESIPALPRGRSEQCHKPTGWQVRTIFEHLGKDGFCPRAGGGNNSGR